MDKAYAISDIRIREKKNMEGEFFDVDTLGYDELRMYIGCLIKFDNKFYWVSEIENIVSVKRKNKVFKGKKAIG